LKPLENEKVIRMAIHDSEVLGNNGHIFYIIVRDVEERTKLIEYLKSNGIYAIFHYVPLHSSPAGKRFGRFDGDLTITRELSNRVVRLPLYYEMQMDQVERVVELVNCFYHKNHSYARSLSDASKLAY
jgi:dTDP-4-amino-4,6-dideoxygalactose transaminase